MKKILGLLLLIPLSLSQSVYAAKTTEKTLVGTITAFEQGDNFYLTIVDKKGQEHTALCSDDVICEKLLMSADKNLAGYKGKKVKVTVAQGKQVDGAGNVMGTMDAFIKIQLLK